MSNYKMREAFEEAIRKRYGDDLPPNFLAWHNDFDQYHDQAANTAFDMYQAATKQAEERYKPPVEAAEALLHERDRMVESGQYNSLAGVAHKLRIALAALEPDAGGCDRDSRIIAELCERGRVGA